MPLPSSAFKNGAAAISNDNAMAVPSNIERFIRVVAYHYDGPRLCAFVPWAKSFGRDFRMGRCSGVQSPSGFDRATGWHKHELRFRFSRPHPRVSRLSIHFVSIANSPEHIDDATTWHRRRHEQSG